MADHKRLVDPPLNSYENKITVTPRLHLKSLILTSSCGIFSILTCRFVRRSERYILVQTPSGIFRFFGFLSRSDSCHALMVLFLDFP